MEDREVITKNATLSSFLEMVMMQALYQWIGRQIEAFGIDAESSVNVLDYASSKTPKIKVDVIIMESLSKKEEFGSSVEHDDRSVKWLRARQKKNGEFVNDATMEIAERIVEDGDTLRKMLPNLEISTPKVKDAGIPKSKKTPTNHEFSTPKTKIGTVSLPFSAYAIEGQVKENSRWFLSLRDLTKKFKCHVIYGAEIAQDLKDFLEEDDLAIVLDSKDHPRCIIEFIS
ncbi:hypothetical protein IFM89_020193 [Coptis chinensis]|uniref:Uncharacterized protein n=1 Tax=Coptis chinensis TaxID=261450 RepID=A0A835HGC5_9MAGN|nr:hypothetical protein IFM89_020193 [Coptis chinensis]